MAEKGTMYVDYLSQPCRAICLLIRLGKIEGSVEEKYISLREGKHKSDEFKKINPSALVPAYVAKDGWSLSESVAIGQYLCQTFKLDDHWYPADLRARARVDEYLAWQHMGMRQPAAKTFLSVTFHKMANGGKVNTEELKERVDALEATITQMEDKFLNGRDFVAGDKISMADLWGVSELIQPLTAGYDITKRHPKTAAWVDRVKAATQPHFDALMKDLTEFAANHQYDYESVIAAAKK